MKDHPHDEFFKYLFSLLEIAREFLRVFLPKNVLKCLDLTTLAPDDTEYITPELAAVYSDKVFRCQMKPPLPETGKALMATIFILLEHKSFLPSFPHIQLNEYRQRIWMTLMNNDEEPGMVLPVILYHGTKKWVVKKMSDYFKGLPKAMIPYLGNFKFVIVDLSKYEDHYLLKLRLGFLAYGMLTMKHAQDKAWLQEQFKVIFEKGDEFLKTDAGKNFVENLFVYYARCSEISGENLKKKVTQNFSDNMEARTLSTYDQIYLEGKIEGEIKGEIKGKLNQSMLFAERLIKKFPAWTDIQIAKLTGLKVGDVKTIRLKLAKKKRIPLNGKSDSNVN